MSEHAPDPGAGRRRWPRYAVPGLLLPLLAAMVLLWSTSDRQQHLDKVPVAIVNSDKIVSQPTTVAAGRSLAASLTDPTNADPKLDWTLTDSDDATSGLRTGKYYAVLTIPSDFSAAIVSTSGDKPVRGQLTLDSNGAASTTLPYISEQVVAAAATALGNQSTQGYLKNVYGGFNQIAQSNQKAATSAGQLADGTAQLSDGAAQLDSGADSLATSMDQVAAGADELRSGTASVSSGTAQVANGATELSQGARKLHSGAAKLARSSRTLAGKATDFAGRTRQVAKGAHVVADGASRLAAGTGTLADGLRDLSQQCTAAGGSVGFCQQLDRSRDRARAQADAARVLAGATEGVARANTAVAAGADALADGDRDVARGAQQLESASGKLSSSAAKLSSGARSVASGASTVNTATGTLAGGTQKASSGATSLASGSADLSSSASSANSGAQSLSSGLAKGAKESPTYTTSQQTALADTVSQPVDLKHTTQHTAHGNGWLLAAILAIILWLAALAGALGVDISAGARNALAPVSSRRIAIVQALPAVGLAMAQAVAVMLALAVLRVDVAAVVPFVLVTLLAALCFALLGYALRLALGGVGVGLFVLFLLAQVAALGNVVPLETAPGALQRLNALMPMTAYVNATSQLASGGAVGSRTSEILVIVVWGLAAFGATVFMVKRKRLVRPSGPARAVTAGTVA